jgi:hypothetical protein
MQHQTKKKIGLQPSSSNQILTLVPRVEEATTKKDHLKDETNKPLGTIGPNTNPPSQTTNIEPMKMKGRRAPHITIEWNPITNPPPSKSLELPLVDLLEQLQTRHKIPTTCKECDEWKHKGHREDWRWIGKQ